MVEGAYEAVVIGGPDSESFLDSLLSQDLAALVDGAVTRSLLLAPRGKLRAQLWVGRLGDEFVLVTDGGSGAAVAGDLAHFKLRVTVTIGERPRDFDHRLRSRQTWSMIQLPTGMISSDSSAMGMKAPGPTSPWPGRSQRTRASAPTM